MHYTTLGRTNLRVSVAGLGTGGFSRLGLKSGKTEAEAARLIEEAVGLGVTFIDTAPSYGTEEAVGRALKTIPREAVVIATKSPIRRGGDWWPAERVVASLDNSLRVMGTCMAMGQAAGTAAALCAGDPQWGGDVRELDVARLRRTLANDGAVLEGVL